jgi:hypothetical protein
MINMASILIQLHSAISAYDDSFGLLDQSLDVKNAISKQEELQRKLEANRLLAEQAQNANKTNDAPPKVDEPAAEPKAEVCEKCKAPHGVVEDLEKCQQTLTTLSEEGHCLRKELVGKLRKDKKWEKAAKIYDELSSHEKSSMESHTSKGEAEKAATCEIYYLTSQHEHAQMLYELGKHEQGRGKSIETYSARYEQSLGIAETTYKRTKERNLGPAAKDSHDLYCLLLLLLKRYDDAKAEHRRVYREVFESDPERALDNGFKLGEIFMAEGRGDPAALKFYQMYQEGKTKLGIREESVLKFGLRFIEVEEAKGGKCDTDKVEEVLRDLWEGRNPENTELAGIGHQYGLLLTRKKKYSEAVVVFKTVRLYQTTRNSPLSKEVLEILDRLFYCHNQLKNYKEAAKIGRAIVKNREATSKTNVETMAAYHALGKALADGQDRIGAERELKKSWEGRKDLGVFDLATLQNGYDYGNILRTPSTAITAFEEVWNHSKNTLASEGSKPAERPVLLSYGNHLASALENQGVKDKYDAASKVYKEVLSRGQGILPQDELLLCTFKSGKCRYLMRDYTGAIRELGELWDKGKSGWGDGLKNYLEAGYYYFQSLKKQDKKHNKVQAKEVIRETIRLARENYGEGSEEYKRYENALQKY